MPTAWPYIGTNHQWSCPNPSSYAIYQQAQNEEGIELAGLWYGEFPQEPSNIDGAAAAFAQWSNVLPGINVYRQLFNQWCFHDRFLGIDNGGYARPLAEQFVQQMAATGRETLWCLMDGPSQRTGTPEPGIGTYWTSYPIISQTSDWLLPATWTKIHASQMNSWTRLCNYLQRPGNQPLIDTTIGFEAINEPDSYRLCADTTGNIVFAMTQYVNHVLAIFDYIQGRFPGWAFDFYVGGWRYSADLKPLRDTHLPTYGKSAFDAIRDHIGHSRIVWSIHMYPDWPANSIDLATFESLIQSAPSPALAVGDRVALTEYNHRSEVCDNIAALSRNEFLMSRAMEWYRRNNISMFYWPMANWAQGRLITARGNSLPLHNWQNAYGGFYRQAAYNNNPAYMTSPDAGIRGPLHVVPVASAANAVSDPDYPIRVNDPVGKFAICYGGRGVAVCQPDEDANNYMFGGNQRNILYGSQTRDDNLNLGRGGGVARCYGGYNKVNVCEGQNLVYGGSLWSLISGYTGQMTVVVNPAATTIIVGWRARKGDKLSFRGAFANRAAMDAAMTVVAAGGAFTGEQNIRIQFPQGGSLTMWGSGSAADTLYQHVLDFTAGWYGSGWTEPADYVAADFLLPIVDPPPPWPTSESNVGDGIGFWKSGARVMAFDRSGTAIQSFWKSGAAT